MKIAAPVLLALSLSAFAAEKQKPAPPQPAAEALDLAAIARIRDEGLNHTRILEYASSLFDGIGASPARPTSSKPSSGPRISSAS
jgi:hypothetical protein